MPRCIQGLTEYDRFDRYVSKSEACWVWVGARNAAGYGVLGVWRDGKRKIVGAHRLSYERYKRPLVAGEVIDHLCRNRACVNPDHLDPCTIAENVLRSELTLGGRNIRKTGCDRGHPYAEFGRTVYYLGKPGRRCTLCDRAKEQRRKERRLAARAGACQ